MKVFIKNQKARGVADDVVSRFHGLHHLVSQQQEVIVGGRQQKLTREQLAEQIDVTKAAMTILFQVLEDKHSET